MNKTNIKKEMTLESVAGKVDILADKMDMLAGMITSVETNLGNKINGLQVDIESLALSTAKGFAEVGPDIRELKSDVSVLKEDVSE